LRSSAFGRYDYTVWQHHFRSEHLTNEHEHATIRDALLKSRHQPIVIDLIEKLREVDVNDPFETCSQVVLSLLDSGVTASAWPKSMAPIVEGLFVVRTEHLVHRLLYDAINHVWNAESALPAIRLGNPDAPDISDAIASVQQASMQPRQALVQVLANLFDRLPIRTWRTSICGYFAKCNSQIRNTSNLLHRHRRQDVALPLW